MKAGSLFSGYGGLDLAVHQVFGAEPAWFSEIEDAPSKILAHHWPDVPNHGDITAIDWATVEPVDVLAGGFPCQDVSLAGKRAGMKPDTRTGLWTHMAYAIEQLRPRYVVAENVRGLLSAEAHSDLEPCPWCLGDGPGEPVLRALGAVLGDLAELGYDAQWCGLRAADIGAPHGRYRVFVLAEHSTEPGLQGSSSGRIQHRVPGPGHRGSAANSAGAERRGQEPDDLATRPDAAAEPGERAGAAADPELRPCSQRHGSDVLGRRSGNPEQARMGVVGAGTDTPQRRGSATAWGQYGPAVERWERTIGRVAPAPTEPNAKGNERLSPAFVEWMMGLPAGHVTAVPGVNRNAQLKALGNGVVPQQAIAALRHMLHNESREVA